MTRDDFKAGCLVVLAIVVILATLIFVGMAHCTHGHHLGVCGREYRRQVGKSSMITKCECIEDHY